MKYEKTRANELLVASEIDAYMEKHDRMPSFNDLAEKSSLSKPALRHYLGMLVHSGTVKKYREKRAGRMTYVYINGHADAYWI